MNKKEVKVGLTLIGLMSAGLGGTVAYRMQAESASTETSDDIPTAAEALAKFHARQSGSVDRPRLLDVDNSQALDPSAKPVAVSAATPVAATGWPTAAGQDDAPRQFPSSLAIKASPAATADASEPPVASTATDSAPATPSDPFGGAPLPMITPVAATEPTAAAPSDTSAPAAGAPSAMPSVPPAVSVPAESAPAEMPMPPSTNAAPVGNATPAATASAPSGTGWPSSGAAPAAPAADDRYADYRNRSTPPVAATPAVTDTAPPGMPQVPSAVQTPTVADQPPAAAAGLSSTPSYGSPYGQPGQAITPPPVQQAAPADRYGSFSRDATTGFGNDPGSAATASLPAMTADVSSPPAAAQPIEPAPQGPAGALVAPGMYKLGANDNYWSISQKVYGSGSYFKALDEHNRDRYPYPDKLRMGDVVQVPPVEELQQRYPDLCPRPRGAVAISGTVGSSGTGATQVSSRTGLGGRTYLVKQGDTLFDIARDQLGKATRWVELYELNRDVVGDDCDRLKPGVELRLPGNRPVDDGNLTTQQRQPFNR